MHTCIINNQRTQFVDTWSSLDCPYKTAVKDLETGAILHMLYDADGPDIAALALTKPELTMVQSTDGRHPLYMTVYKPSKE